MPHPNRGNRMNTQRPALHFDDPSSAPEISERRLAPWLLSAYPDPVWTVTDTKNSSIRATINFDFKLADGRSLLHAERFCATVKEYAFWVRDSRFSRIDDATTHQTMVRNLMSLAHALSLRNFSSFAHVQPYDLDLLIDECRYGSDTVLHASERVEKFLQKLKKENSKLLVPEPFGGLPRYVHIHGSVTKIIHAEAVIDACELPSGTSALPRVAALIGRAAAENGLKTKSRRGAEAIPLPNLTVQALQRWLDPLEQLYAMRRKIVAESLNFKPFPRGAGLVAKVKGVGTCYVRRSPRRSEGVTSRCS